MRTTPTAGAVETGRSAATRTTIAGLPGLVGTELGSSGWIELDQARIDLFAEATEDRQWIHTDPARAARGPFGGTIAHGYLTLSLVAALSGEVLEVSDAGAVVNYGLAKARFPAPVPSGTRVRLRLSLAAAEPVTGGMQAELDAVVELETGGKPALAATVLLRFLA